MAASCFIFVFRIIVFYRLGTLNLAYQSSPYTLPKQLPMWHKSMVVIAFFYCLLYTKQLYKSVEIIFQQLFAVYSHIIIAAKQHL